MFVFSPDGAKFLRGDVIETEDGPRLLPPDLKGDGQMQMCVQGFDISMEEVSMITYLKFVGFSVRDFTK